jgi:DNA-binding CsgD family transcriptional regulator
VLTRGPAPPSAGAPAEPIHDPVLRGAVLDVLGRVDRALGVPSELGGLRAIVGDVGAVRAALATRTLRLAEELRRPPTRDRWGASQDQLVDLLLEVRSLGARVDAETEGRWAAAFARLAGAVAIVRRAQTLQVLLAEGPGAVVALGFDRAIISSIRDGTIVLEYGLDVHDPEAGPEIVRAGAEPMLLDRSLRESDMLRTREPLLVHDAQGDPRGHPALARATGWSTYVAAPVTVGDAVVGFVHADRGEDPVGEVDAEILRLFAEALGLGFERLVAEHRTERARIRVGRALSTLTTAFEPGGGEHERARADPRPEVEALLTSREAEVLRLMASGATNAAIAATLVIAEGTAKTHVKNILRKLEAGNRAEAVSRFLGGVGEGAA